MKNLVLGTVFVSSVALSVGAFAENALVSSEGVVPQKKQINVSADLKKDFNEKKIVKPLGSKLSKVVTQPLKISNKKVSSLIKTVKISASSKK